MRGLECATFFWSSFIISDGRSVVESVDCCLLFKLSTQLEIEVLQLLHSIRFALSLIYPVATWLLHAGCAIYLDIGCCIFSDAVVDINMIDLYSSPTRYRNICSFHSSRRCKPLHRKLCEFRISNTARIRFASDSIVVPKVLRKFGGGRMWLWEPMTRKAWFIANVRGGNGRKLERMRLGLIYNNDAAMYYLLLTLSTAGCWRVDCAKCRQNNWLAFLPHVVDAQLLCRNILSINITNSHWCTVELL